MEHHLEFGRFRYREAATAGRGEGVDGTLLALYPCRMRQNPVFS
jgi:hypothetical protein